ncbi:hypothetical protein BD408DRAFT_423011 [Parasitella parasitica]|nr:hypothetical protein BD408DRAFT_423011 [Parasitella parasitica]
MSYMQPTRMLSYARSFAQSRCLFMCFPLIPIMLFCNNANYTIEAVVKRVFSISSCWNFGLARMRGFFLFFLSKWATTLLRGVIAIQWPLLQCSFSNSISSSLQRSIF